MTFCIKRRQASDKQSFLVNKLRQSTAGERPNRSRGIVMMELRPTGIGAVSDMPWGKHFCHFYETKEDLLDTLVPYFKAGLDNNECCLWVICEPLNEADATNALRTAVPGIDKHLSAGDIEIVSHRNWYLKNGGFGLQQARDDWKDK